MADKRTALAAMRDIFLQANPAPSDKPANVWIYPQQYNDIDTSTLPIVIISELVNNPNTWMRATHRDLSHDIWAIEAMVFLYPGPLTKDPQAAAAEKLHITWAQAIADTLYNNQNLFNNVFSVGVSGDKKLFDYQVGEINWWNKLWWGVRFVFPITQSARH